MGGIKIGKYQCKSCDENLEEDRSVWEELKTLFLNLLGEFYQMLRCFIYNLKSDSLGYISGTIIAQNVLMK